MTNETRPPSEADSSRDGMGRRQFFRAIGRGTALAAIAAAAVVLVRRSRAGKSPAEQDCVNLGICRGCPVYDGCALPQALSRKNAGSQHSLGDPGGSSVNHA